MSWTLGTSTLAADVLGGESTATESILCRIQIEGVDRTGLYEIGTLSISDALNQRNTASFTLHDLAQTYFPAIGHEVEIVFLDQVLFRGTINELSTRDFLGCTLNRIDVRCVDFNQLADRFRVAAAFEVEGQTLKDVVDNLVNVQAEGRLAAEGVTTELVQEGPVIQVAKFNFVPHSRAFDDLAKQTGFAWNINYQKQLEFFDRSTFTAPFGFGVGGLENHRDMEVRTTRAQYRNKQIVRAGNQVTDEREDTFAGDGETTTFTLRFPLANDVETDPPTIEVNGMPQTVGINGVDEDEDFDWFVQRERDTISQSGDGTPLTSVDTLSIVYKGLFPIIVDVESSDEIDDRAAIEGGTGVYTEVENDTRIDSRDLALVKADELLRRFGVIPVTVSVTTQRFGLRAGHLIEIVNPGLGIDEQLLIERVQVRHLGALVLEYRIDCISGELLGGWVEFFKRLQEQGVPITVRENEKLVFSRVRKDTVTLSDVLTTSTEPLDLIEFFEDAMTVAQIGTDLNGEPSFVIGFGRVGQHPLLQ